jgi:hypothetical protein
MQQCIESWYLDIWGIERDWGDYLTNISFQGGWASMIVARAVIIYASTEPLDWRCLPREATCIWLLDEKLTQLFMGN